MQPRLAVVVLAREAQVECEGLLIAIRVFLGATDTERVGVPKPAR
jgi:hypothetical protein